MRSHSFNQLHTALNHTITVIYCKHICTFKDSWERFLTYYLKVIYPNPLKTRLSINTVNIYPPSTPCTVVYSRCRRHIPSRQPHIIQRRFPTEKREKGGGERRQEKGGESGGTRKERFTHVVQCLRLMRLILNTHVLQCLSTFLSTHAVTCHPVYLQLVSLYVSFFPHLSPSRKIER